MIKIIFLVTVANLCFQKTEAQSKNNIKSNNVDSKNVAAQGYDVVAYFKINKATKGNKTISIIKDSITYFFSTEENKNTFIANPNKYIPKYGGWCAYAMGKDGSKVEIDPATFKITNGELFLFYNKNFTNTLKLWDKDENNLKTKADQNWGKVIK
jgi:hypothetical protein